MSEIEWWNIKQTSDAKTQSILNSCSAFFLLTLIAAGIVQDTRENMFQMIHNTGITYLKGLGVIMEDEVV